MDITGRILGVDDTSFLRSIEVQLVMVMSMVSSMGVIASPALPAMSDSLGIPEARIGLVFTAFTLPAIFALPVVGAIGDLYSRKVVVVPGLLLFGIAGATVGLVRSFEMILILRALQGIGYTAFNSLTVALLGDLLSGPEESAAQGSRVIFNKLTSFVGPVVAGVVAGIAWQYPFYLYVLGVPVGIFVYLYYEEGGNVDAAERINDTSINSDENRDRGLQEYGRDLQGLMSDPFMIGILGSGFIRMFLKYALYTFLALAVISQYSGSDAYAGFLVGLYSGVGAFVASQSARLTERFTHSYALILGLLIASIAFMAFPLANGLIVLTILVLLHGIGEGIINPVHKSIMTQSVRKGIRGGLVTTNAIVQNTAKTITPVSLSPLLIFFGDGAYDYLFLITGGISLVATVVIFAVLLLWTPPKRQRQLRTTK